MCASWGEKRNPRWWERDSKYPAPKAALINGVSGHAMDYDDTQLSTSKEAVYGLLTHPTTPVLNAAFAMGEKEKISGEAFLLAYIVGVEVECRIADAINPHHYQSGFHSTATIGGLGAAMAVGKILRLKEEALIRTLGIAASMASGLRENFGTMTKPLHAGRAAENGVTAALLAQAGFTSATNILEARRGFFHAMGGGFDESKIPASLGRPYFMLDPGISIKPYPSGSLSHPAQDLILDLVKEHDLRADDYRVHRCRDQFQCPQCFDLSDAENGAGRKIQHSLLYGHCRFGTQSGYCSVRRSKGP